MTDDGVPDDSAAAGGATGGSPGKGHADRVDLLRSAWERERPDLDVSPQGVVTRLHRVANHLTDRLVEVYRKHGLGEGDFDVLATLRRGGAPFERSAGDLAEHTLVTTGGMTKRIDRLERAGLVERRRDAHDGRGRVVALTGRGREVIDAAYTEHIANEHRLVAMIGEERAGQLEQILRVWLAALEEPPAHD